MKKCGKCCGGCEHFLHEDAQGFGICEETVDVCRCSDDCHLEPPTERQVEVEEKTSLWERLKICWHVLTKRYYIFLSASKDTVMFDKDGNYVGVRQGSLAAFSYTGSKKELLAKDGREVGMREVMWGAAAKLAVLQQS